MIYLTLIPLAFLVGFILILIWNEDNLMMRQYHRFCLERCLEAKDIKGARSHIEIIKRLEKRFVRF